MHPDMLSGFKPVSYSATEVKPVKPKDSLTQVEREVLAAAMHILFQISDNEEVVGSMSSQADPIGLLLENFIGSW